MRSGSALVRGLRDCPRCGGTGTLLDPAYQGEEARRRRKKVGLSLREVARRIELSVGYLSDLELGRRGWNEQLTKRYRAALK